MKKIVRFATLLLAVTAFSFGCKDANEDMLSNQNQGKVKPTVSITTTKVGDNDATFTLTASDNAAQYAYAVTAASTTITDPRDLVFDAISAKTISNEVFSKETSGATTAVLVEKLAYSTSYNIYAAAITKTGLVGEISTIKFSTSDTSQPKLSKVASQSVNGITLTFNEPVQMGTGNITYDVIAWGIAQSVSVGNKVKADEIEVDGSNVIVTFAEPLHDGAAVLMHVGAGAVKDIAGNESVAVASALLDEAGKPIALPGDVSGTATVAGIYWENDNVNFDIADEYYQEIGVGVIVETVSIAFPFDVMVDSSVLTSTSVTTAYDEGDNKFIMASEWKMDGNTMVITLPRTPNGYYDFNIDKGILSDIYGNVNNAAEYNKRYQGEQWVKLNTSPVFVENLMATFIAKKQEDGSYISQLTNTTYAVTVEKVDGRNKFRIVNGFGAGYPYNEDGDYDATKDYYIVIDCESYATPETKYAYIPLTQTELDWGYGPLAFGTTGGNFEGAGVDAMGVYDAEKGTITFDSKSLVANMSGISSSWFYSSCNGESTILYLDGSTVPEDQAWQSLGTGKFVDAFFFGIFDKDENYLGTPAYDVEILQYTIYGGGEKYRIMDPFRPGFVDPEQGWDAAMWSEPAASFDITIEDGLVYYPAIRTGFLYKGNAKNPAYYYHPAAVSSMQDPALWKFNKVVKEGVFQLAPYVYVQNAGGLADLTQQEGYVTIYLPGKYTEGGGAAASVARRSTINGLKSANLNKAVKPINKHGVQYSVRAEAVLR